MKVLYIHIGTEKTGSTSIQRFLGKQTAWLSSQKLYSPSAFCAEPGHHYHLVSYAKQIALGKQNNTQDPILDTDYTKKQEELLDAELRSTSHSAYSCVLSSEHFFTKINTRVQVKALDQHFRAYFSEIKYILYFRDPIWHVSSWVSTRLKNGIAVSGLYAPHDPQVLQRVCTKQKIKVWLDIVGRENLIVKQYGRNNSKGGDIVMDLCQTIIPSLSSEVKIPLVKRANTSLTLTAMRYLYFINNSHDFEIKPSNRLELAQFLSENLNDGSRFVPSYSEYNEYSEYYRETIDWILETFFTKDDSFCQYDKDVCCNESIDLSDDLYIDPVSIELIKKLWVKYSNANSRVRLAKEAQM